MKILHISHSDTIGGAARAAYRLHKAQLASGFDSEMMVRVKKTDDWTVLGPSSKKSKAFSLIRPTIGQQLNKLQRSENSNFHSGNWLPSNWSSRINRCDADVVHLHWVAGETMSIYDIGRIKKPIVWTLHDMWPFCGMEHVTSHDLSARWRQPYTAANRGLYDKGIDLDRFTWTRKKKYWKQKMNIVAPSEWMADCVRGSELFSENVTTVIPNTLNTDVYKPLDRSFCRQVLRLPLDKKIILFGAMGGGKDFNKGYDLLLDSLNKLVVDIEKDNVICVIFGQSQPQNLTSLPYTSIWLGHVFDDVTLSILYNSADVMVVPSRIESFGQTASEAQACGIPVVAFNSTGLKDVIEHSRTGYLASHFDTSDLAKGIQFYISPQCLKIDRDYIRKRAIKLWSYKTVSEKYADLYSYVLNNLTVC
ncbi:glycosyltransferase [Vibrio fluvialis]|nr:glycosyltransferase [Vibrio fluvialis]MBY7869535.1 glycosyltransferase [Vibrio fluvialis]